MLSRLFFTTLFGLVSLSAQADYSVKYHAQVFRVPDSGFVESPDGKRVWCGHRYNGVAHSKDGRSVCAGGLYPSFALSRDKHAVACGGQYAGSAMTPDGRRVCAGGLFDGFVTSSDGRQVACGLKFHGTGKSLNGKRTCLGGVMDANNFNATSHNRFYLEENVKGIAQYQRQDGSWGKVQHFTGTVIDGYSLSQWAKKKGYSHHYTYANLYYLVRFGKEKGYVALNLHDDGGLQPAFQTVTDQRGRVWRLKAAN